MKNIFLFFLLYSSLSFSQGGPGMGGGRMGGQRPMGPPPGGQGGPRSPKEIATKKRSIDEQVSFLKENLKLDELQELLIREQLLEEKNKRQNFSEGDFSGEELQDKMQDERKKREDKFKKILSEEQFKKWMDLENHFSDKNKAHPQENPIEKFRKVSENLDLTEDQKIKIERFINPETKEQPESFDPQKKEKEFEKFLKSILDKNQYKKWMTAVKNKNSE